MKKRVLKKENLDEIGTDLLDAARMSDAEIENIVNKPQLFDSVVARIKIEERNQRADSDGRKLLPSINFRFFDATATALILVIAAIIAYNGSNNSDENQLAQNETSVKPQIATALIEKNSLPALATEPKLIVKATTRGVQSNQNSNRQRQAPPKSSVRKFSRLPDSPPAAQTYTDEGKFYALPFADDAADDNMSQFVRAELSRAELSALGIELPLADDDDERILTDLIYGANGTPKAFRLIAKL